MGRVDGSCLLIGMIALGGGCDGQSGQDPSTDGGTTQDGGNDAAVDDGGDGCTGIDEITSKVYFCFVIHNEEDDANGIPGSSAHIPDYNDDPGIFDHFADAMVDYAVMLSSYGATLSFQPDWTFTEGVERYRPQFFVDLLALGHVEIVPHAHETVVAYDELYDRLGALGASPQLILGGMTFDAYRTKQAWFATHPEFAFWGAPTVTVGHVDDQPAPPFAYRIPMPEAVTEVTDLYTHAASSPVIATPGLPPHLTVMFTVKPGGRYLSPSYSFNATREFLAEASDTSVPAQWRKQPTGDGVTAAELIASIGATLEDDLLPLVSQGRLEFKTVGELLTLYRQYESCLDLVDGQDLSGFVPSPP